MGVPRMIRFSAVLGLFGAIVAGCDNSASQLADLTEEELIARAEAETETGSGFARPDGNGGFGGENDPVYTGQFADAQGNGFAYEVRRTDTNFYAVAGILPDTQVGVFPDSGMAAMSGIYQVAEIGNSDGEGRDYAEAITHSGRITLRADFEFGTLQGASEDLTVDGTFSSSSLTGNVYFKERLGTLTGKVGSERAVGAFHGVDDDTAMSGGFLVEP